MKRFMMYTIAGTCILAGTMIRGFGQPPTPPPMPVTHGQNGAPPVGAPIDGGLGMLLALGAAYGGRKAYRAWKARGEQANR